VFHLDSDDWIEADALEALYAKQRETGADVVMGGICDVYHKHRIYKPYPVITNDTNPLSYFFLNRCRNIVAKIYKKSLFEKYIIPSTNIG